MQSCLTQPNPNVAHQILTHVVRDADQQKDPLEEIIPQFLRASVSPLERHTGRKAGSVRKHRCMHLIPS